MEFVVAIATYAREETIGPAVLETLKRAKVDDDQIKVFVPNEEQLLDYRRKLGNRYELIVSCPGQFAARQFYHRWISEKYGQGFKTIQMDDDIYGFWELIETPERKAGWDKRLYEGSLEDLAKQGYGLAEELGTGLWGMGITQNYFFMQNKAMAGNMLIAGGFQGVFAGDDIFIGKQRTYAESAHEDVETCCLAFIKYGKLVKLPYFSIITKDIEPGGIRKEVTDKGHAKSEAEAAKAREMTDFAARKMLSERYPELVSLAWAEEGTTLGEGTRFVLENGKFQHLRFRRIGNSSIPRRVVENRFLGKG